MSQVSHGYVFFSVSVQFSAYEVLRRFFGNPAPENPIRDRKPNATGKRKFNTNVCTTEIDAKMRPSSMY